MQGVRMVGPQSRAAHGECMAVQRGGCLVLAKLALRFGQSDRVANRVQIIVTEAGPCAGVGALLQRGRARVVSRLQMDGSEQTRRSQRARLLRTLQALVEHQRALRERTRPFVHAETQIGLGVGLKQVRLGFRAAIQFGNARLEVLQQLQHGQVLALDPWSRRGEKLLQQRNRLLGTLCLPLRLPEPHTAANRADQQADRQQQRHAGRQPVAAHQLGEAIQAPGRARLDGSVGQIAIEVGGQRRSRLVAILATLLQRAQHDAVELPGQ